MRRRVNALLECGLAHVFLFARAQESLCGGGCDDGTADGEDDAPSISTRYSVRSLTSLERLLAAHQGGEWSWERGVDGTQLAASYLRWALAVGASAPNSRH